MNSSVFVFLKLLLFILIPINFVSKFVPFHHDLKRTKVFLVASVSSRI